MVAYVRYLTPRGRSSTQRSHQLLRTVSPQKQNARPSFEDRALVVPRLYRRRSVQLAAEVLDGLVDQALVAGRVDAFRQQLGGRRDGHVDGLGTHLLHRPGLRTEERRVGKRWVRTCYFRGAPYP